MSEKTCKACDQRDLLINSLEHEIEALRADLVWAVNEGSFTTPGHNGRIELHYWEPDGHPASRTYDGTAADLLRAIREARVS